MPYSRCAEGATPNNLSAARSLPNLNLWKCPWPQNLPRYAHPRPGVIPPNNSFLHYLMSMHLQMLLALPSDPVLNPTTPPQGQGQGLPLLPTCNHLLTQTPSVFS